MVAPASAPRPVLPRQIYFENSEMDSADARNVYDSVIYHLRSRSNYFPNISHLTNSDALHLILSVFQNQPPSLEFLAMRKVLELDLGVEEIPEELQVKALEESIRLIFLFLKTLKRIVFSGLLHKLKTDPSIH